MNRIDLKAYDPIAPEYYNPKLHPTCANFREASARFIWECLYELRFHSGWVCEVGAGRSILLEFIATHTTRFSSTVILDSSLLMLNYSREMAVDSSVYFVVGNALNLPVPSNCLSLLVSSLGDAYNTDEFWREVRRVLHPGGWVIFTIPDYEWAAQYRPKGKIDVAEFTMRDGQLHSVPSLVCPTEHQYELFNCPSRDDNENHSFLRISKVKKLWLSAITTDIISPKLYSHLPIISCYMAEKVVMLP